MKIYKNANEIKLTLEEVSECKLLRCANVFGLEPMYKCINVDINRIGNRNCYKIVISKIISFNDDMKTDLLLNNIVEFTDSEVHDAEGTMYKLVDHVDSDNITPENYTMSFVIR